MTTNINITDPVLLAGESFGVRYRELPSGSWVDLADQTSNQFTIPGLSSGNYQLEVTFMQSDGTECEPTLVNFTVPEDPVIDCECPTIESVYIQRGCDGVISLHIDIDISDLSACNYEVIYSQQGSESVTVNYDTLPSDIDVPLRTTENVTLIIRAYCCETDTWLECYNETITDIHECECTVTPDITSASSETLIGNQTKVTIVFMASTPNIPPYNVLITSGSNTYTTNVNVSGTYQFIIPFVFLATETPTIQISNYCGSDIMNITTDISPCDSDITVTDAVRGYDPMAFPQTYGTYVSVTFTESNTVSPPYVIEIWDVIGNNIVTSYSVNSAGTYDIAVQKTPWSRELIAKVISPCDQDQRNVDPLP